MSTQDKSMTPIERPEGLLCDMPMVIKGKKKKKSTLKRPFETLNDAFKECFDTYSLEGPVLSKRSKNSKVLSASTNITKKLIPPVTKKTFKSNGLLTSANKQMDVDLWPPLEPDRFAGLLLLESCGASFLCILENSFRLCGLQNYSYQCVAWGKGHICRLFVSNKMLAVEKGSSPDLAIEAAAKIAVKRLINYHYILKIKPNMSLDQLVARPTLPTQETNVSSVHSSSRSDKDSPFFRNKGTKVIKKSDRNLRKRYKRNSVQVGKRLASSACPRESNQTRPAGIGTDVVNNSVSPIFLSWARSIVKHAGKYSHNLVFSPLFSREELEVIKRVGQKANLRPSFRGNVEGEDLQLVLGRDIWTIARELLKVGGHNDNYQLIPPRNMGTLPSPICHSTTSNQQVPNSTQDSMTSNQTSAELDLKTFKAGPGIGAPSVSKEELTRKSKYSAPRIETLTSSRQEVTVKQEHSVSKDQEITVKQEHSFSKDQEITVKQEHSVSKDQEITVKQEHSVSKDQEITVKQEHSVSKDQEITVKQEHSVSKDQEITVKQEHSVSKDQEITVKQEHSVSKDQEMATLSTSEQEITVKQEHSVSKDQEITVKQEHLDEKTREMMTLQSDTQENPCELEHFLDPILSLLFLTGPFGRLVVVDEFTTNYQKILTTTASSNKIILARQFGRMPSNVILCRTSLNNQLLATGKGPSQAVAAADAAQKSVKKLQQHYYTLKAKCKYWSHKVVHPSMIIPADSLEELVHQLAEQMGWKPLPSQEVEKSSRTSTGLSTFPRSFSEWGEVLIETYKHIESWEDLTFSPDFSSEDKTVLARIALESGLLCRRVKTSNFLLLVVSKQFFLSKVIKSLITFPELNNKYELLPPEIIPQLEMKDKLDKAMNSPEDEHQTLCDPAKTKQMKDPLNCRVIESLSKTCDEKPVASSSNLVGVDKKHSLLRNKLRTNLSSKGTLSNRPSFLKDPQLAKVLPNGDYGQMVLLDSCDLGAVIEDVIRSLSESCIDFEFVHVRPKKRKEREFGLKLNTCKILIGGKTVTIGQHKKMRGAAVIAANKLMTKLKLQHFFVKGPRPRFLPVPFISDEKAFVIYAEKLLQEYSREETSSALVLKTDLRAKKEKILGRIAKRLDLKMFRSQPNIHSIVITKLTNFWTLVKLLASGDQNANYKLIAPPS